MRENVYNTIPDGLLMMINNSGSYYKIVHEVFE